VEDIFEVTRDSTCARSGNKSNVFNRKLINY